MDLEVKDFSYDEENRIASVQYGPLKITSKYLGRENWNKGRNIDNRMPDNWNDHDITVVNTEIPNGAGTIKFQYWESILVKVIKTKDNLLSAFGCLLSDAYAAESSYEDFCSEFAYEEYDEDGRKNKESMKIYKACKESIDKLRKLGVYSDRHQFMEDLQEKGLL